MSATLAGMATADTPAEQPVFTVSGLNRVCRFLLNESLGMIRIEGEISNFTAATSGHLYFTLKDTEAQVRCAMFRPQAQRLRSRPQNGDHVLLGAQVSLYEPRGDYQLIVESLEPAGNGALALAFERLKARLAAEGLFDEIHKQPLPALPKTVGVITSPTGAAIRDILTVLRRRFPAIEVVLYPTKVQGSAARDEIVRALQLANRLKNCDVIILGRGGGSTEDLWCFNEEAVARAIFHSHIPVVSAVGHETDFTISDFVADLRAPTPSAAAVAVSPDRQEWLARLDRLRGRLSQNLRQRLEQARQQLRQFEKRLASQHPEQRLRTRAQRLDELELRMNRAMRQHGRGLAQQLLMQRNRLLGSRPDSRMPLLEARLEQASRQLAAAWQRRHDLAQHRTERLAQALHAVSPLATLARGYSITTRVDTGALLHSPVAVEPGTHIRTLLRDGILVSTVETIENPTDA